MKTILKILVIENLDLPHSFLVICGYQIIIIIICAIDGWQTTHAHASSIWKNYFDIFHLASHLEFAVLWFGYSIFLENFCTFFFIVSSIRWIGIKFIAKRVCF